MSDIKLTVLGCGSSSGVPMIACNCIVCQSTNPKNKRLRCSAYVSIDQKLNLLIDTGPDLRYQALRAGISKVDAVLYTHSHADHLNGIDDLRSFCYANKQKNRIPLYGNKSTLLHIKQAFSYAFAEDSVLLDKPIFSLQQVDFSPFVLHGIQIIPILVKHGHWDVLGWRIGNIAWLSDVSAIPHSSKVLLKNLDVLFFDCLRFDSYPSHTSFDEACAFAKEFAAKRTILIDMSHSLDFDVLSKSCPIGIEPAYDGMQVISSVTNLY